MSRAQPHTTRERGFARLPSRLADLAIASVPRLALATLAGSILIIVPIALWANLGDGDPMRTAAIALAALLVAYAVVRQVLRPLARRPVAATRRPDLSGAPARRACRAGRRHATGPMRSIARGRELGRPASCSAGAPLRPAGSRLARDVRCRRAASPLARRSARRRTRP